VIDGRKQIKADVGLNTSHIESGYVSCHHKSSSFILVISHSCRNKLTESRYLLENEEKRSVFGLGFVEEQ
jgi:hypothetical protein